VDINTDQALKIISLLADGKNPHTGEIIKSDSVFQNPDTVRALFKAQRALEGLAKSEKRKKNLPENAGKSWSSEEDRQLANAFNEGSELKELAKAHKRTEGAISSRLVKLGVMTEENHSNLSKSVNITKTK
jgi:hypothetical protein